MENDDSSTSWNDWESSYGYYAGEPDRKAEQVEQPTSTRCTEPAFYQPFDVQVGNKRLKSLFKPMPCLV